MCECKLVSVCAREREILRPEEKLGKGERPRDRDSPSLGERERERDKIRDDMNGFWM